MKALLWTHLLKMDIKQLKYRIEDFQKMGIIKIPKETGIMDWHQHKTNG